MTALKLVVNNGKHTPPTDGERILRAKVQVAVSLAHRISAAINAQIVTIRKRDLRSRLVMVSAFANGWKTKLTLSERAPNLIVAPPEPDDVPTCKVMLTQLATLSTDIVALARENVSSMHLVWACAIVSSEATDVHKILGELYP